MTSSSWREGRFILNPPTRMGVVAHPRRPESIPAAEDIANSLMNHDMPTWVSHRWDAFTRNELPQTDMIVALGGDGAMLRAARHCAPHQVPVLGVNMGYLGFLPEVRTPEKWSLYLPRILAGDFWIERRMTIHVTVLRDGREIASEDALNDIVISRSRPVGTVLLQTYIDNDWATTYHADALIIATPTGSTGYALSAGGPILPPELHNILILPVAAHLSLDRPLVVSEGVSVQVVVSEERENDIMVIVDGMELCEVRPKDIIAIRAGKNKGLFVRMQDRNYFYRSILDRLEPRVPSRATPNPERLHIELKES